MRKVNRNVLSNQRSMKVCSWETNKLQPKTLEELTKLWKDRRKQENNNSKRR